MYCLLLCRYCLLLRQEGQPVAAATFNIFTTSLPAQVSLLAEIDQSSRGHTSALFEILSGLVSELEVPSIALQPPVGSDVSWATRMGFKPMHPIKVAELHKHMPVAFLDAPVYELKV